MLLGTDGITEWTVAEFGKTTSGRLACHNILKEKSGPTPYAKRYVSGDSVASAWRLFIDETILKHIKHCTETEARRVLRNELWSVSLEKLEAFIALLYARGVLGVNRTELDELWSKTWGIPFFNDTMGRNSFREILRFLRFDFRNTRSERLKTDKFALVSKIWNKFIENCRLTYVPGENLTADEQLFPSKTRCPFLQYMPNKPDKFGIKFWLLVDVDSKFLCNGFPYLGKDDLRPRDETLPESVIMKLMEPFQKKGRNVTTDNFFTTVKLGKKLKSNGTSIVGTIRRSRKEIPNAVKTMKAHLYDSALLKHSDGTLTVYQGKRNKNVLVYSTLHSEVELQPSAKRIPETIDFYNNTKYGVDVIDQMGRKYTVRAGTRRWPVHVFYNILDLAAINSWIIFKKVTGKKITRRNYILKLAEELRMGYLGSKPMSVETEPEFGEPVERNKMRRQCQMKKCRNKTSYACKKCKRRVCGSCSKDITKEVVCSSCF